MKYNNLSDFARRKAALKAELNIHEKQIAALKKQLLAPVKPSKKKKTGLLGRLVPDISLSTMLAGFDGALFAWKLYRKLAGKRR